jgi:predicted RNA-binding Zn ribbon-like protein
MDDMKHGTSPGPLFLAGSSALDFMNTRMKANGHFVDFLQSDEDVLRWLKQAGIAVVSELPSDFERGSLLDSARTLRENIRSLVEKRKAAQRGDAAVLNGFLAGAESHLQLVWSKPRRLRIETVRRQDSPAAILGPIAESAANLLATADFRFVKRCESETCVLWFSDQTKSHRRRWCSTMLCGNRHKVAAYRRRRHEGG